MASLNPKPREQVDEDGLWGVGADDNADWVLDMGSPAAMVPVGGSRSLLPGIGQGSWTAVCGTRSPGAAGYGPPSLW